MNKEIKFRGKSVYADVWVYGYVQFSKDESSAWICESKEDDWTVKKQFPVIPKTVGQYTGLKDKNDKEIFEGDIIKGFIPEMASEPERIGAVKFGNYGWIVDFKTEKWECRISKVGFCSFRDYEVIGNIYENPELLIVGEEKMLREFPKELKR